VRRHLLAAREPHQVAGPGEAQVRHDRERLGAGGRVVAQELQVETVVLLEDLLQVVARGAGDGEEVVDLLARPAAITQGDQRRDLLHLRDAQLVPVGVGLAQLDQDALGLGLRQVPDQRDHHPLLEEAGFLERLRQPEAGLDLVEQLGDEFGFFAHSVSGAKRSAAVRSEPSAKRSAMGSEPTPACWTPSQRHTPGGSGT
jgi:hypothetical protein